jgi:hypothetical protein
MASQHVTEEFVFSGNASDLQLGGAHSCMGWDNDYPD